MPHVRRAAVALLLALAASAATAAPPPDTVAEAVAATVAIAAEPDGGIVAAGFLDAATGLIVTNAHVVAGRVTVAVAWSDGTTSDGAVVAEDPVHDLALVRAPADGRRGLAFAEHLPAAGAPVFAIGSPFGLAHSVTGGVVSATGRAIDQRTPVPMIQHDASLNPGSSGGPLIDGDGRVVGVNTGIVDGFRRDVGIGYAIPGTLARGLVDRLARGEDTAGHRLGASLRPIEGAVAEALGLDSGSGLLVETVDPGGPAAAAGIAPGMVVAAIAGVPVSRPLDAAYALAGTPVDRPCVVTVAGPAGLADHRLPPRTTPAPDTRPGFDPAAEPVDFGALGLSLDAAGRIAAVMPGGIAARRGLQPGERIRAVDGRETPDDEAVRRAADATPTAPPLLLVETAGGGTRHVLADARPSPADGLGGNIRPRDVVAF